MIWRHLLGYLPASLAGGLASFAAVFAFTRLLGAEAYGWYALVLTGFNIAYTLLITWGEASAYRFAGEAQARGGMADHIRTTLGLVALSTGAGLLVLACAAMLVTEPSLRFAILAAAAVMLLSPIVTASQEMNRACGRVARYSAVRMTQDVGAFLIGVFLAWRAGLGPAAPFAGLACVLFVLAITEGTRLWRESAGGRFDRTRIRRYLGFGMPVAVSLVLAIALDAGDRFLIALYLGPEAVGIYAAGYGVVDKSVGLICIWAAAAGGPLMLAAWERDGREGLKHASAQAAATLMLVAAPAAAGLALVAHPLAEVMIAEDMREQAAAFMPWIALSGLMNGFVLHYLSESFQLSRRTDLRAALMAIPAVANLGLNVLLIPPFGLMGAVYATVASYALALVLLGVVGRRLAPLSLPMGDFARIGAACVAMAIAVQLLPAPGGLPELLLKAAVGACVYAAAAVALNAAGARAALGGLRRLKPKSA